MLEARHLKREYKTKNGPTVKALDDVSVSFGETGMVFILGKSGSGKSTLLNVLGGLDKYDSGEVIVKGKSSKDFSQADFDSYRNTFIGFIFQEYNILDEFNVSKNIGLALELQGRKADRKSIEELMEQVDLKGYGKRKPNTLSGGQKQRVAIARALVKNPEIIMADEPTGALDSNTGKQVFDTLKKLSKYKLVLVVSHDRDFAEIYGDRIIELADGKIISDISKYKSEPKSSNGLEIVDDKIMTIRKGTHLDKGKTEALIDFIINSDEDIVISKENKANEEFKRFARIDEEGNKESFKNTEKVDVNEYDPKRLKLIRSKLPNKDAFKMGASGLKHKPFRLFLTILLSAVSFGMFGLADTMGSYDKVGNTIKSIMDSNINYASFSKSKTITSDDDSWDRDMKMNDEDIAKLNHDLSGFNFVPVYNISKYGGDTMSFSSSLYNSSKVNDYNSLYRSSFYGAIEIDSSNISSFGDIVAGSLPTADDEIVITKYNYESFVKASYKSSTSEEIMINSYSDLIGKTIEMDGKKYTIKGILDTHADLTRYSKLDTDNPESMGSSIVDYMIISELGSYVSTSYHSLVYVNPGFVERYMGISKYDRIDSSNIGIVLNDVRPSDGEWGSSYNYIAPLSNFESTSLVWKNEAKTALEDNEILISYKALQNYYNNDQINIGGYDIWFYQLAGDMSSYGEEFPVNVYKYYANNSSALSTEMAKRVAAGETWDEYEYKSFLSQNINDIDWRINNGELRPLSSEEEAIIIGARSLITNCLKDNGLLPTKAWMKRADPDTYNYPDGFEEYDVLGICLENPSSYYESGLVSTYLYNTYKDYVGGKYSFAVSPLNSKDKSKVTSVVKYNYANHNGYHYSLENTVMTSINSVNSMIESMAKVFLYIGIGFAVFAALLLLNFITISISYKKREIGILRAIGARGMDVFKIFFNESFLIAFINFVLASVVSVGVCIYLNHMFRSDYGLLITLLNIGIRQIGLMFAMAVAVAFVSSFFPVLHVAKKKPIDSIRNA